MNNVTLRKFFMSRIDSLQREVEFLQESVKALDSETSAPQDAAAAVEPKKEKAAPKAEAKAEPKKEKAASEAKELASFLAATGRVKEAEKVLASSDDDLFGDESLDEEIKAPTIDDVREIGKRFMAKNGKEKTLKLLQKFKVESMAKLDAKDFKAFIDLASRYL